MGRIRITGLLLVLVLLLAGCGGEQAHTQQLFAMDTIMNLTAYGGKGEQALSAASEKIGELEKRLSVTDEGSEIYAINHAGGQWVQVSQDTYDLISTALSLCRATGGALDITAYPAVRAWGFTTGEYQVPGEAELEELAAKIDYNAVELDESTCSVRLPQGMELDLGAVAKGWTGRCLAELLRQSGVKSAVLALGGNAQTVGTKPGGSSWRVGIQDPAGSQGAYLATVAVEDKAVVTSGGYQR